jgi:uncharacterized membrane protein YesL
MSTAPKRILFRVVKGFIYGNVLGLFFAIAVYLLASAVSAIVALPMAPSALALIVYSASVLAGVASEYSTWLEAHS